MDLEWIWDGSGVDLEWIWDGSGVDLGWIWDPVRDPALIRFRSGYFHNPASNPANSRHGGWRAGPPTGDILDPFFTSIRTL